MNKSKGVVIGGAVFVFFAAAVSLSLHAFKRGMATNAAAARENVREAVRRETALERKIIDLEVRVNALEVRKTPSLLSPGIDLNVRAIRDLPTGTRARF